jgi:hypothetical protein
MDLTMYTPFWDPREGCDPRGNYFWVNSADDPQRPTLSRFPQTHPDFYNHQVPMSKDIIIGDVKLGDCVVWCYDNRVEPPGTKVLFIEKGLYNQYHPAAEAGKEADAESGWFGKTN